MTLLEEVPGAGERPGGSRIRIEREDAEQVVSIVVPARPLPFVVGAGAAVLAFNLLAVLYMGLMLFVLHRSVGVMAQIAPHDLPLPLRHWSAFLVTGWAALEALGVVSLLTLVRPAFARERLHITPERVWGQQDSFGRRRTWRIPRASVYGFVLKRDPQGLTASILTVQSKAGSVEIAEYASEAEREWLCSVGNALLRP